MTQSNKNATKLQPNQVWGLVAFLFLLSLIPSSSFAAESLQAVGTPWWHGAFFGAITILILINVGQFGITRESAYLFYGLFLTTLSISLANWLGYFAGTWLAQGIFENYSLSFFVYLTIITYSQFCRSYFQLQYDHTLWNTAIHCLCLVVAMAAVISYFTPTKLSNTLLADTGILAASILFMLSIVMVIENEPRAQTFMLTRLIITPPAMALAFSTFQFVPWSNDIYNLVMVALCVEAMILTYSQIDQSVKTVQIRLQNHHNQSLKHVLQLSQIKILRSVSREIRSPISGVIGMAQLLQDTSLTRNQREQVQTIRRSGEALLKWLNRLTNWSAIRSDRVQLTSVPFDLPALVTECIDDHIDYASDRHVDLKLELDKRLPPLVNGDPERVKQILTGLLGHALFYSEQGKLMLVVKPGHDKHQWSFVLIDSSSGLQTLEIEALHAELDDTSHTSAQQDWYIAQELSKVMNGTLRVHVERQVEGHNSAHYTLTLTLPRHTLLQHNEAEYDHLLRGKRLLIVDGNAPSRKLLSKRAESWGMRVHSAPSATDALDTLTKAQDKHFDIIVLDQNIPDLAGLELAGQLNAMPAIAEKSILIMLTGANTPPNDELATHSGIRRVLRKPITSNSLKITLAEELTLAQNRRHNPAI
jgi:signal transduction histidine kinase/ActR/RegA family two-component response regulator